MSIISIRPENFPGIPAEYNGWSWSSSTITNSSSPVGSLYLVYTRAFTPERVASEPELGEVDDEREIRIADHPADGGEGDEDVVWYVGPYDRGCCSEEDVYDEIRAVLDD